MNESQVLEVDESLMDSPQSLEDLMKRKDFQAPIDPHTHELKEVLATYSMAQKIPCGLSTCRTEHLKGLLVKTSSGVETNIGHVCGRNHFGEAFVIAEGAHRRKVERFKAHQALANLRQEQKSLEEQVTTLIEGPFGVHWQRKLLLELQRQLTPEGLKLLKRKIRRNDLDVRSVTERSEEEIQKEMARTHKRRDDVRYKSELVGRLRNMPWLIYDFKATLIDGIREPLRTVCNVDESNLETPKLQKLLKPLSDREYKLREAKEVLDGIVPTLTGDQLALITIEVQSNPASAKAAGLNSWYESDGYRELMTGR